MAIGTMELLLILPFIILGFVFWLWMMVDCLKRPDEKFAFGGNYAKIIWIIVIIFAGFIGALIYFFLIKKRGNKL